MLRGQTLGIAPGCCRQTDRKKEEVWLAEALTLRRSRPNAARVRQDSQSEGRGISGTGSEVCIDGRAERLIAFAIISRCDNVIL